MKKKINGILLFLILLMKVCDVAFAADITSDIIGKFSFEENAINEITGIEAMQVSKGTLGIVDEKTTSLWTYVDGVNGKALYLCAPTEDGKYNENGLNLGIKPSNGKFFTVSAWVSEIDESKNSSIIWVGKSNQKEEKNWIGIGMGDFDEYVNCPTILTHDILGFVPDERQNIYDIKKGTDALFSWTMLTMVVENDFIKLYYDGQLVLSTENFFSYSKDENGNKIGGQIPVADVNEDKTVAIYLGTGADMQPFNGYIDEVYVYDRALTEEDIALLVKETNKEGVKIGDFGVYEGKEFIEYNYPPLNHPHIDDGDKSIDNNLESKAEFEKIVAFIIILTLITLLIVGWVIYKRNIYMTIK